MLILPERSFTSYLQKKSDHCWIPTYQSSFFFFLPFLPLLAGNDWPKSSPSSAAAWAIGSISISSPLEEKEVNWNFKHVQSVHLICEKFDKEKSNSLGNMRKLMLQSISKYVNDFDVSHSTHMFVTMTFRPCLCCTINTCGIMINFSRTTRLPDVPSFLSLVFPFLKDIIKVVVIVLRTQLQQNNMKNATICQQSVTSLWS